MDKWYVGYNADWDQYETFSCDNPDDATPEASGYETVEGPFDSKEEADANNPE